MCVLRPGKKPENSLTPFGKKLADGRKSRRRRRQRRQQRRQKCARLNQDGVNAKFDSFDIGDAKIKLF